MVGQIQKTIGHYENRSQPLATSAIWTQQGNAAAAPRVPPNTPPRLPVLPPAAAAERHGPCPGPQLSSVWKSRLPWDHKTPNQSKFHSVLRRSPLSGPARPGRQAARSKHNNITRNAIFYLAATRQIRGPCELLRVAISMEPVCEITYLKATMYCVCISSFRHEAIRQTYRTPKTPTD